MNGHINFSTLLELIDFGIERPKYSCDVVGALLKVSPCDDGVFDRYSSNIDKSHIDTYVNANKCK